MDARQVHVAELDGDGQRVPHLHLHPHRLPSHARVGGDHALVATASGGRIQPGGDHHGGCGRHQALLKSCPGGLWHLPAGSRGGEGVLRVKVHAHAVAVDDGEGELQGACLVGLLDCLVGGRQGDGAVLRHLQTSGKGLGERRSSLYSGA